MAEGDLHRALVQHLILYVEREGYENIQAAAPGYPDPLRQGAHEPDLIARHPVDGRTICGEAKRGPELRQAYVLNQLQDFTRGWWPRPQCQRLVLCVPEAYERQAVLAVWFSLGRLRRPGSTSVSVDEARPDTARTTRWRASVVAQSVSPPLQVDSADLARRELP